MEMAHIEFLDELNGQTISQQDSEKPGVVVEWHRSEAQGMSDGGIGDSDPHGHDDHCQQGDRPGGTALQEGDLRRADHVYDQSLGKQTFNEPSTLEKALLSLTLVSEQKP